MITIDTSIIDQTNIDITGVICYVIIQAMLRLLMNILGYFTIVTKTYKISDSSWLVTFGNYNMMILSSFTFDTVFLFYSNWVASVLTQIKCIFSNIFCPFCNVYFALKYDFSGIRLCNLCSQSQEKSSRSNYKQQLETSAQRVSFEIV